MTRNISEQNFLSDDRLSEPVKIKYLWGNLYSLGDLDFNERLAPFFARGGTIEHLRVEFEVWFSREKDYKKAAERWIVIARACDSLTGAKTEAAERLFAEQLVERSARKDLQNQFQRIFQEHQALAVDIQESFPPSLLFDLYQQVAAFGSDECQFLTDELKRIQAPIQGAHKEMLSKITSAVHSCAFPSGASDEIRKAIPLHERLEQSRRNIRAAFAPEKELVAKVGSSGYLVFEEAENS